MTVTDNMEKGLAQAEEDYDTVVNKLFEARAGEEKSWQELLRTLGDIGGKTGAGLKARSADPPKPPLPSPAKRREIPGALLTTKEAADYLSVSVETVRRMARRRALAFVKVTRKDFRYRLSDLENYVAPGYFSDGRR